VLWGVNNLILWWFGICWEAILRRRGLDWGCSGFGWVMLVFVLYYENSDWLVSSFY